MSRKDEFKNENTNPAKRFLEWKSDLECFSYYDKDKEERVEVKLPFKFLTLKEMQTVKGWNDASESAIFSNEVKYISTEELNVRSFKGGTIAKGLYKNIRSQIHDAGGHYVKSIYIMVEDGEIWNLQLKGSAVSEWSEFTKKTRSRLGDEWVEVTNAEKRKKGAINYTVPVFRFNTSLDNEQGEQADLVYATLKLYMDAYLTSNEIITPAMEAPNNSVPVEAYNEYEEHEKDDLPF